MKKYLSTIIWAGSLCLALTSCKCDDPPAISYFAFEDLSPVRTGVINQAELSIAVEVPASADLTDLSPTIRTQVPECHTVTPASLVSQDFTHPVLYRVENEAGEAVQYEVSVIPEIPNKPDSIHIAWSSGMDIPHAVAWSAISELDNQFYVSGGISPGAGMTRMVQVYNPGTDSWTVPQSEMKHVRWGHSSDVVGGKIYVLGGTSESGKGEASLADSTIEVYDPATEDWEIVAEWKPGRIGHGTVTYQGKIYVAGGENKEPDLSTLRAFDVYDPASDTWESLAPMGTSRIFMALCRVEDTIYAIGGGSKYPYSGIRSIEAYIIPEDRWEPRADLKVGLGDLDACVIDGKIFLAGGWSLWGDVAMANVQVYDPELDRVFLADGLNFARGATATFSFEGKIYVASGFQTLGPVFTTSSKTEIGFPEF